MGQYSINIYVEPRKEQEETKKYWQTLMLNLVLTLGSFTFLQAMKSIRELHQDVNVQKITWA
jgi:hypothetical protein